MRRARAIITGRVQGVSYRASAVTEAHRLGGRLSRQNAVRSEHVTTECPYGEGTPSGLTGWVRNLPDNSVEIEVEGPLDQVSALLAWCAHGPPAARVTKVSVEELAPTGSDSEFRQVR